MTGKEAKNYIINALPLNDPEPGSKMLIGKNLVSDFMECSFNDIGELANKFKQGGLAAIENEQLYGYTIVFRPDQPTNDVRFETKDGKPIEKRSFEGQVIRVN